MIICPLLQTRGESVKGGSSGGPDHVAARGNVQYLKMGSAKVLSNQH